jgi:beta-glucanase (GH16 family)
MLIAQHTRARATALLIATVLLTSAGVSSTQAAPVAKPKATKAASITGLAKTESALSGIKGTWSGKPTFSFKWYACATAGAATSSVPRGCTAIAGATKNSLIVTSTQEGKFLRFATTAKNRGGSVTSVSAATSKVSSPYTLLWSDEFTGDAGLPPSVQTSSGAPDANRPWQTTISGQGGGNRERQYYTDGVVQYNADGSVAHYAVELDGQGHLNLNAAKPQAANDNHPATGIDSSCWYGSQCEFLSGRIDSKDRLGFKYGLLETRVKLSDAPSTWPAFWMLGANYNSVGWPACGEIDIMESAFTSTRGYTYFGSLHSLPDNGFGISKDAFSDSLYTEYHTFGLLRTPTKIEFRFDGKTYFSVTKAAATSSTWAVDGKNRSWPFDQEFYMIYNLAMGGTLGGGPGGYASPSATGGTISVDWVRFSSVNGEGEVIHH